MPVRLSGVVDLHSNPQDKDGLLATGWEARYPALPPWHRDVHRFPCITIALDVCGEPAVAVPLATAGGGTMGVAGTIRLDHTDEAVARLRASLATAETDAELILHAYRRSGTEAFSQLAGDFAFVLWDTQGRCCYLVRDLFGVRRLHYAAIGTAVVFSTDVEAVLAQTGVDRRPDEVTILDTLLGRCSTKERTFFSSIKRVQPRQFLRITATDRRSTTYWLPSAGPSARVSLEDYGLAFNAAFQRAVADRLPPLGGVLCHVSGGLDSTSVASLTASRLGTSAPARVVLASARFPGLACDEGPVVQEFARWLGLPVREWDGLVPETSDLTDCRIAWPFGRSSIAGAQQGDLALASQHAARVLLSGFGGNQVTFEEGFLRDAWRTGGWRGYARGVLGILRGRPWTWSGPRFRRTFAIARRVAREHLPGFQRGVPSGPTFPPWFRPPLTQAWTTIESESAEEISHQPITGSWTADALWEFLRNPGDVWALEHEDARANERGMEFRYPYLSRSLVEIAMSVPWQLRAPSRRDRSLQRTALRGVLPDRLRLRDTFADFNAAIVSNTMAAKPLLEDILTRGAWRSGDFIDRDGALTEFRGLFRSGRRDLAAVAAWRTIRDVVALEAWLRRI